MLKQIEADLTQKIEKLPLWAREFISDLVLQRDRATKLLHEFTGGQTPTSFFHEESLWGPGGHVIAACRGGRRDDVHDDARPLAPQSFPKRR